MISATLLSEATAQLGADLLPEELARAFAQPVDGEASRPVFEPAERRRWAFRSHDRDLRSARLHRL